FDAAIVDMVMPEMDGLALAKEIRRLPNGRELLLVLMTSLGRISQARSAGEFAAQLVKPLKASQLYNALAEGLAGRVSQASPAIAATETRRPTTEPLRIL